MPAYAVFGYSVMVERTEDGRYVVIKGRRWRATDPELPEELAARLRQHLMSARRAVGAALKVEDPVAEKAARSRVQTAKEALGERGAPWWELPLPEREARWVSGLEALDAAQSWDVTVEDTDV